jgi:SH3 domain-containing protein
LQTGLPIREKPDALSDRVYRLRSEEEIKILSRSESQAEVGNFSGYWYKVITEDGTLGYVFDRNLVIYEKGTKDEALSVSNYDPRLDDFFTRRYYPERYMHLIERGTIDLQSINPAMGLIPDQENGSVSIISPRYSVESVYSSIMPAGNNRYFFTDTTLYITFENPEPPVESLTAQFRAAGNDVSARYVSIPDIEEILDGERARREEVLQSLIEDGGSFVSTAYGSLTVDELGSFVWEGKERLVPAVLKERYGNRGVIRFDRFLSPALASSYDGAATFRFAGAAANEAVTFLFNQEPQGLRLTLVPEENVSDLVVEEIGYNPLVLFMSRQE